MLDPFAILSLPRRFDLADAAIRRAFLTKVQSAHPDAGGDQDIGATLTQARDTLLNPESRADALLLLLGGPAKDADKSLPPGFLMEIMETREALDAALASKDIAELERLKAWATTERQNYIQTVAAAFAAGETKNLRTTLNAWRYIERMLEQTDPNTSPLDL
ncbi:MAG TPA: iron-sulfur cluster co-chaperone HscB C-terminal domain-containing protein [Phycisphaerales bacterium]